MDKSDIALQRIERTNGRIVLLLLVALSILVILGAYSLFAMQKVTQQSQEQIKRQSELNAQLIKELKNDNDVAHIRQLRYVQCLSSVPLELRSAKTADDCLKNIYPNIDSAQGIKLVPSPKPSASPQANANPAPASNGGSSSQGATAGPTASQPVTTPAPIVRTPAPVPTIPPVVTNPVTALIDRLGRIIKP